MKIKNLALIILMTIFLIIFGIKVEAATGIINEDAAKLKKAPDSKVVLDLLDKGLEVEILEEQQGWYKVKAKTSLGKVTGYVSSDVLEVKNEETAENTQNPIEKPTETPIEIPAEEPEQIPVEPQENIPVASPDVKTERIEENKQYILTQEVSIKALPLMSSTEKAKISGTIKIIEIINDWSRIENDTEIGWIRTNILQKSLGTTEETTPIVPEQQPVPEEQPGVPNTQEPTKNEQVPEQTAPQEPEVTEINKTGYVKADGLRVRKGPSTGTEEITSLGKNDKVKIVGKTGNWYKIDLDGKTGYVSAKYISDTKIAETTSRGGSILKNEETPVVQEKQPAVEQNTSEQIPPPAATTSSGSAIVEYAKQYLGYKYVSGGASPETGFDCSGFTSYVYKNFGISLYRTSRDQIKNGVAVEKSNLQPGDLVIFNNDANTKIGHVGIYIGDGNFIHAANKKSGVKITKLDSEYYYKRYVGARRAY